MRRVLRARAERGVDVVQVGNRLADGRGQRLGLSGRAQLLRERGIRRASREPFTLRRRLNLTLGLDRGGERRPTRHVAVTIEPRVLVHLLRQNHHVLLLVGHQVQARL